MQTWVDLKFADGEYTFKLPLAQIIEIERKCGPIGEVYARTLRGRYGTALNEIEPTEGAYRFGDLVEVIRQALIGGAGGMSNGEAVYVSSVRANELLETYVYGNGFDRMAMRQTWALAAAILSALIEGYEPPKKAVPGESPAPETTS